MLYIFLLIYISNFSIINTQLRGIIMEFKILTDDQVKGEKQILKIIKNKFK